uniref:Uncharacterized protein n=1 Tax=Onchocerca volvulus TaxID=6282 RepID=A0A8R1TN46_ONCVO
MVHHLRNSLFYFSFPVMIMLILFVLFDIALGNWLYSSGSWNYKKLEMMCMNIYARRCCRVKESCDLWLPIAPKNDYGSGRIGLYPYFSGNSPINSGIPKFISLPALHLEVLEFQMDLMERHQMQLLKLFYCNQMAL